MDASTKVDIHIGHWKCSYTEDTCANGEILGGL